MEDKLLDKTMSLISQKRHLPSQIRNRDENYFKDITKIVLETELAKQIKPPLTEQQRTQLVLELVRLNLPLDKIQEMAQSVKYQSTYGSIAIEYWTAPLVCLKSDLEKMAWQLNENRLSELNNLCLPEEKIKIEAKQILLRNYYDNYEKQLEIEKEKLNKKVEKIRKVILKMSRDERKKILEKAVKAKLIPKYDEIILNNLHNRYIIIQILPCFKNIYERK